MSKDITSDDISPVYTLSGPKLKGAVGYIKLAIRALKESGPVFRIPFTLNSDKGEVNDYFDIPTKTKKDIVNILRVALTHLTYGTVLVWNHKALNSSQWSEAIQSHKRKTKMPIHNPLRNVTPEMLRKAQRYTELGAYTASRLAGAYDLMTELYQVMFDQAVKEMTSVQPDRPTVLTFGTLTQCPDNGEIKMSGFTFGGLDSVTEEHKEIESLKAIVDYLKLEIHLAQSDPQAQQFRSSRHLNVDKFGTVKLYDLRRVSLRDFFFSPVSEEEIDECETVVLLGAVIEFLENKLNQSE